MSYKHDYFISYAQEDNADGFVGEFVERLVKNSDLETLLGAKPRVFFDQEAAGGADDWESAVRAGIDASRRLLVFLSPNYFKSERCAAEFARWLESDERRALPDSGITPILIADVPGLFDDGPVDVPQALLDRFPNWVSELRKRQISGDFDLRDGAASIDAALAALCRAGRDDAGSRESASAAQEDGSSPDDDEKNDADVADDSSQTSENYEKAVEKIEELFEENPDEIDQARVLNARYMKTADRAKAEGKLEDAKERYEKALEGFEKIIERTPDDIQALSDLGDVYYKLGFLSDAEGDSKQAKEYFEKALEIRKKIVEQTQDDLEALSDLSSTYNDLGFLSVAEGDRKQAREYYEKALEGFEKIVERTPDDIQALSDLSATYYNLLKL